MWCVLWCTMIHWLRPPLLLLYMLREVGFTMKDRVSYSCVRPRLYLYLPILQDLFNDYLLNRLGYGPPDLDPYAEWADSWRAPCSFSSSPVGMLPMVPNLVSRVGPRFSWVRVLRDGDKATMPVSQRNKSSLTHCNTPCLQTTRLG
jgi:hypothetical protein